MKDEQQFIYQVALSLLPQVGDTNGKKLVAYAGGVEALFREPERSLRKIPGISRRTVEALRHPAPFFRKAEKELVFVRQEGLKPLFFLDDDYPTRLKACIDSPLLLFSKGSLNLNHPRVVSIVGTRTPTDQGRLLCEKLSARLAEYDVMVVSGLAYGIDVCAHRTLLKHGGLTVGVMGASFDHLYPAANKQTALEMMEKGMVVTEFRSGTMPDRQNFPQRNRIVAGMSDATIVVESGVKGGSMITARQAFSYSRDVFAFPGAPGAPFSAGCNALIKQDVARLIEEPEELLRAMNWMQKSKSKAPVQRAFFVEMEPHEEQLYTLLKDGRKHSIDSLSLEAKLSMSKTSAALLSLEFKGVVKALPGKAYCLMD